MHNFIFSRGPIKLYPLPGTEEYVAKVAHWLAGNLLKDGAILPRLVGYIYGRKRNWRFLQ